MLTCTSGPMSSLCVPALTWGLKCGSAGTPQCSGALITWYDQEWDHSSAYQNSSSHQQWWKDQAASTAYMITSSYQGLVSSYCASLPYRVLASRWIWQIEGWPRLWSWIKLCPCHANCYLTCFWQPGCNNWHHQSILIMPSSWRQWTLRSIR